MNLNDEVRCDFFVDRQRKAIWKSQLNMLAELLRVCDENNIKIFAVAGTMLGAIRHKGYIPWDDDVDMAMMRDDFNKLMDIGPKAFKSPLFLQTAINEEEYYSPLLRLRDSNTTAIVRNGSHDDYYKNCNCGIYIDIFPLDGLIEDNYRRKIQFFQIRLINMILRERVYLEKDDLLHKMRHSILSRVITKELKCFLFKKYNDICSRYSYQTEKVALLQGSVYNKAYYWYLEDIRDVVQVEFEDILIPVPIGMNRCLEIQYGDYMKLPPIESRGTHHQQAVVFDPFLDYVSYKEIVQKNEKKQNSDK